MQNNKCPYCGNNPVPHFLNWYFESVNILFTPVRTIFLKTGIFSLLRKAARKLRMSFALVKICKALGIISYQTDIEKCKVPRARVLWEEANRRGVLIKELLLFGKPFDTYMASKTVNHERLGIKDLIFSGLPRPENYNDAALDALDDKAALKKKFLKAGLPVPAGGSAWTYTQVLKIFNRIEKPVIVKPRAGSRGRHSTTHVYTTDDLKKAFRIAKQLCFWVMVEEHIPGPVYRATVIDYQVRGVLRGDSPQIVGDGISTIAHLVAEKNSRPHPGVKDMALDEKSEMYLNRLGLSPSSVPAKGQPVTLSEKIGVNYGGSSSEDLNKCHPDNVQLFQRAARVAGDPIVGFDYIISDISKSFTEQKTGFIEANSLPFINLHHDPLHGTAQNVAKYVWELVGM